MESLRPCGKEKFQPKEKDCLVCPSKIECIFELARKLQCALFLTDGKDVCYSATAYSCSPDVREICTKIKTLNAKKFHYACENFGAPKKNELRDCLKCCKENVHVFEECEATELQFKNLELSIEDAKRMINRELNKLSTTENDCYNEGFAFEDTCWNDCEFKLRCLPKSGVYPGKECRFYPDTKNLNLNNAEKPKLEEFCANCIFLKECNELLTRNIEVLKKEWEEKKLYRTFFSLTEIRSQLIKEE